MAGVAEQGSVREFVMDTHEMGEFIAGLAVGQCWQDRARPDVCRMVIIDPALDAVEVEDRCGHVATDTIGHFLSTHFATTRRPIRASRARTRPGAVPTPRR
jgi:hypothetical protein